MNIYIRPAVESDLAEYTDLLQRTYEVAYVNNELGLTKDQFSKEVFATKSTQDYLEMNLVSNEKQKAWIALDGIKLIGSITVKKLGNDFTINGFYVDPAYQGQGIGKQLWNKAIEFAPNGDIIVDLYTHNEPSLAMYKKWGFEVDTSRGDKGYFHRHWDEWPAGLNAKCVYMRLKR